MANPIKQIRDQNRAIQALALILLILIAVFMIKILFLESIPMICCAPQDSPVACKNQIQHYESMIEDSTEKFDTMRIPERCFGPEGEPLIDGLSGAERGDYINITKEGYEVVKE